jgi:hypothetical protein
MDERPRFVARLLEGGKTAVLCREFDVSRKTGYGIFTRYKDCGLEGLTDRNADIALLQDRGALQFRKSRTSSRYVPRRRLRRPERRHPGDRRDNPTRELYALNIGFFDHGADRIKRAENPFASPMSSE